MNNTKIGIIGGGNMGKAFFNGLLKKHPIENLYICDKDPETTKSFNTSNAVTDAKDMIDDIEVVILAIKPQNFEDVAKDLKGMFDNKLVISIMAGIGIKKLEEKTGSKRIIRSMPNLPVQYEKGLTGWTKSEGVNDEDVMRVKDIFGAVGVDIEVDTEEEIDYITALSGSGPAYFFYLTEMIEAKAKELGFDMEHARTIAESTFLGTASMFKRNSKLDAGEFREKVTSDGGTTEAAINTLIEKGFADVFNQAIDSAIKRSQELNN